LFAVVVVELKLKLIVMQIVMCMVMTIFGAMFAVLQVTMAAVGAGVVQNTFGNRFDGNCGTCKQVFISRLHRGGDRRY